MCAVQSHCTGYGSRTTEDPGPATEDPGPLKAKHQPFTHRHDLAQEAAPCQDNINESMCTTIALLVWCNPGTVKHNTNNSMLVECFAPWTLGEDLEGCDLVPVLVAKFPVVQPLPRSHGTEKDVSLRDVLRPHIGDVPAPHGVRVGSHHRHV